MPNHCMNQITITGPQEVLVDFYNGLKKFKGDKEDPAGELSIFSTYVPMPEEFQNTVSPSETPNWYDWIMENWGSKWGDYDTELTLGHRSITGWYSSAWGPCSVGLQNLSSIFPSLNFRVDYHECGMNFRGFEVYQDGAKIEASSWEMNKTDLEELGYDECEEETE